MLSSAHRQYQSEASTHDAISQSWAK
uniref:Uncharacterized protein n=1 Tax=Arundo donax TaxID=35708 RepID=A0A0A9B8Z9_ARUDO